jgi:SAM-dependent methyltransferase
MADTYFQVTEGASPRRSGSAKAARGAGDAAGDRSGASWDSGRASPLRPPIEYLAYPPTSLPHRDLLVLEQLPIHAGDRVCEIGVGSGGTAARIARLGPAEVVGVDVSASAIEAVRDLERRHPNLRLAVVDVTRREAVTPYASRFDVVLSCDTLEHVEDPPAYFRAIAEMLAPGGRCFITFPNEPPGIMHGITRFDTAAGLETLARRAGLADVELGAARLSRHAAKVVDLLGWRPLAMVRAGVRATRTLRGRRDGPRAQRFEDTSFHQHHRLWSALSPMVNLYWYGLLRLMAGRKPAFEIDWDFSRTPFEDSQVVIRAVKPLR